MRSRRDYLVFTLFMLPVMTTAAIVRRSGGVWYEVVGWTAAVAVVAGILWGFVDAGRSTKNKRSEGGV